MRTILRTLFMTASLGTAVLTLTAVDATAQTSGAVRVREEKTKTIVYEIRIDGMKTPAHATALDAALEDKMNFIDADTRYETGICTLEVMRSVRLKEIEDVILYNGYRIAKTF